MTRLEVYDCDAKEIWEIADANGITPAEVVEELVYNFLQEMKDAKQN